MGCLVEINIKEKGLFFGYWYYAKKKIKDILFNYFNLCFNDYSYYLRVFLSDYFNNKKQRFKILIIMNYYVIKRMIFIFPFNIIISVNERKK